MGWWWMIACVGFNRGRGTTIGVAFTKNGVYGATLNLVVAGLEIFFISILRFFRIVWQIVALFLQFLNTGVHLGKGGADVGKLDDVGFRGFCEFTEFSQCIMLLLGFCQTFREHGDDASGQGAVAGFHFDAGGIGEGFDNGEE